MLILSRRIDESIQIGDEITVTILGITGKQVWIGISAHDNVTVHREEVYERVQVDLDAMDMRKFDQEHPAPDRCRIPILSHPKSH